MFRKVAVFIAALLLGVVLWVQHMAPLTVTIGSGPIALVQNGVVTRTVMVGTNPVAAALPVASTAGTTLIAIIGWPATGPASTSTVNSLPAGWTRLVTVTQGTGAVFEAWSYPNNPGGILAISISATTTSTIAWRTHMSEWSGVLTVSALETSGTATATGGSTLALATTGNVVSQGDLVIAAWAQGCTVGGPFTFTTPSGFTRLIAGDGSDGTTTGWLDAEYQPRPMTGAPLNTTLTSTGTTNSAAGAVIVLKRAPQAVDQTAYLAYG